MSHMIRAVFVSALFYFILAAATPSASGISARRAEGTSLEHRQFGQPASSCAEEVLCCDEVESAGNPGAAQLLALLGISVTPDYQVGLDCVPITIFGAGGSSCSAQPACCFWGAEYSWVVAIDCYPVDLSL